MFSFKGNALLFKILSLIFVLSLFLAYFAINQNIVLVGVKEDSVKLTGSDLPEWVVKCRRTWTKRGFNITEEFYVNEYVMLSVERARNSSLSLAIVKVEGYCELCYPNVGITKEERLQPERIEAFNKLKKYVNTLWSKYGHDPRLSGITVNAYVVPRSALTVDEFLRLIEELNLTSKVKDIYYTVYDTEGNYVMGGGRRIRKGCDFLSEVTNMVKAAHHMLNVMNKSNYTTKLYIGSFVIESNVSELAKLANFKEKLALVYVPLDIIIQLRQEGYNVTEVRYTSILKAIPELEL